MDRRFILLPCLLYFLCISSCSSLNKLLFKSCGDNNATVSQVLSNATLSDDKKVALLEKGTSVQVSFVFQMKSDAQAAESVVHGVIEGLPVPFSIQNPDACKNSNLDCPLKAGSNYQYNAIIPVKSIYPKIRLVVKWELTFGKDDDADIWCEEIPVEIVDKPSHPRVMGLNYRNHERPYL